MWMCRTAEIDQQGAEGPESRLRCPTSIYARPPFRSGSAAGETEDVTPVGTFFASARLDKPAHLRQESWDAIQAHVDRLNHAMEVNDKPLCVGAAKELTESVARVIVGARGRARR